MYEPVCVGVSVCPVMPIRHILAHVVPSSSGRSSHLPPTPPDHGADCCCWSRCALLCFASLLLKTLCRAHYKLIIPVLSCAFGHTLTHTHTLSRTDTLLQVCESGHEAGTEHGSLPPSPNGGQGHHDGAICYTHTLIAVKYFAPRPKRNMKRIIFIMLPIARTNERMNGVCVRKYIYLRAFLYIKQQ